MLCAAFEQLVLLWDVTPLVQLSRPRQTSIGLGMRWWLWAHQVASFVSSWCPQAPALGKKGPSDK